ncbi:hypothetical protein [Bradyrhizobium sp. 2TAF24]|uniref:hypothetical protein n=1 Tax=Bradyrhizobium sp. 2TAF24 TaxID=3233011 RepID=UPI003F922031
MADYYPLIARAIAGLEPGAPGEARRALYERARAALISQLRSVEPPLTESEITRERLALEEAVRKVEAEAAQRARIDVPKPDPLGRARPGDALRSSVRSRATPTSDATAASRDRPAPRSERTPLGHDEPRPPRNLRADVPVPAPAPEQADSDPPHSEPARPVPPPPPVPATREGAARATPPGVRGFRDVIADADDLGAAAAQANRAARRTYANVPSPSPEFDRIEPNMDNRVDPMAEVPYDALPGDAAYTPDRSPAGRGKPAKLPKPAKVAKPPRPPSRFPLAFAIVLGLVLTLAGVGFLVGPKLWGTVKGLMKSQPVAEAPKAPASDSGARPKIADRVGQPGSQIAPVAQKVVLYDEDPSDPQGKRYEGTVVWRTDQVGGTGGQPQDLAIRADIQVPERKLKMSMTIRRNMDTSLPASHTAELTFALPPDFAGGGVANVPGILMKSNEQTKGLPLAGLAVKVTDGFFLVGLSNIEADKSRNLQLLKERSWFDIPLVYVNQRRAILAVEKGAPGERAFNEAFMAWGQ